MLSMVSPISASTSTTCSGATPNFSFTPGGVVPGAFVARVEDADAVADELEEVLVARDDRDLEAGRRRLLRQRADHVVGFVAFGGEDRHAERLARRVHHRDLHRELVGHRRAVGFVVGDQVVAEGAAGQIERRGDVLRLVLVEQLPQHRDEDVDRVGGLAPARCAAGRRRPCGPAHDTRGTSASCRRSDRGGACRPSGRRNFYYIIGGHADRRGRRAARRAARRRAAVAGSSGSMSTKKRCICRSTAAPPST